MTQKQNLESYLFIQRNQLGFTPHFIQTDRISIPNLTVLDSIFERLEDGDNFYKTLAEYKLPSEKVHPFDFAKIFIIEITPFDEVRRYGRVLVPEDSLLPRKKIEDYVASQIFSNFYKSILIDHPTAEYFYSQDCSLLLKPFTENEVLVLRNSQFKSE